MPKNGLVLPDDTLEKVVLKKRVEDYSRVGSEIISRVVFWEKGKAFLI